MTDVLHTARDVAELLGISVRRVYQLAETRRLGRRLGPRAWVFTDADVDNMRVRKTGRPRKAKAPE